MQSKLTLAFFGLLVLVVAAQAETTLGKCGVADKILPVNDGDKTLPTEWKDVTDVWKEDGEKNNNCSIALVEHLTNEFKASLSYLALSAFFQSEKHFLPGLAKFFLDSAAEERSHAKQMMEYVLMRGGQIRSRGWENEVKFSNEGEPEFLKDYRDSNDKGFVMSALKKALELEQSVTKNINEVIEKCQDSDYQPIADHRAIDYLTAVFLAEQHESTRQLAGMIATLKKLSNDMNGFTGLAEVMFDQTLA